MMMPVLPDGFGSRSFFFSAIFPFSCLLVAASSSGFFSGFCVRFFFLPCCWGFSLVFRPKIPLGFPLSVPGFSSFFFSLFVAFFFSLLCFFEKKQRNASLLFFFRSQSLSIQPLAFFFCLSLLLSFPGFL